MGTSREYESDMITFCPDMDLGNSLWEEEEKKHHHISLIPRSQPHTLQLCLSYCPITDSMHDKEVSATTLWSLSYTTKPSPTSHYHWPQHHEEMSLFTLSLDFIPYKDSLVALLLTSYTTNSSCSLPHPWHHTLQEALHAALLLLSYTTEKTPLITITTQRYGEASFVALSSYTTLPYQWMQRGFIHCPVFALIHYRAVSLVPLSLTSTLQRSLPCATTVLIDYTTLRFHLFPYLWLIHSLIHCCCSHPNQRCLPHTYGRGVAQRPKRLTLEHGAHGSISGSSAQHHVTGQ